MMMIEAKEMGSQLLRWRRRGPLQEETFRQRQEGQKADDHKETVLEKEARLGHRRS